ncbi:MAG: hypothetical protein WAZ27_05290 [Minisyncoccia bacterium]
MVRLLRAAASSIQALLDIVLPRKERVVRALQYSHEDLFVTPTEHTACGITITTLLSYREKPVEDCIRAVKYDRSTPAAKLLAEVLTEYLREEIAQLHSFSTKTVFLIPIPLHRKRYSERGFNQIELICAHLPDEFRDGSLARIGTDILMRVRETESQTRLSRTERLMNVKGAFVVSHVDTVLNTHVILIDDVTTTGATLAEAARPLLNLEIPVSALALARA